MVLKVSGVGEPFSGTSIVLASRDEAKTVATEAAKMKAAGIRPAVLLVEPLSLLMIRDSRLSC